MPEIFDKSHAAELLGVSIVTLDRLRAKGQIPFRQIGGLVKFTEADILLYLERSSRNGEVLKPEVTA